MNKKARAGLLRTKNICVDTQPGQVFNMKTGDNFTYNGVKYTVTSFEPISKAADALPSYRIKGVAIAPRKR